MPTLDPATLCIAAVEVLREGGADLGSVLGVPVPGGSDDPPAVLRVRAADRGPVPVASDGEVVARGMPPVQRVSDSPLPVLLHQGPAPALQTRLRQVWACQCMGLQGLLFRGRR